MGKIEAIAAIVIVGLIVYVIWKFSDILSFFGDIATNVENMIFPDAITKAQAELKAAQELIDIGVTPTPELIGLRGESIKGATDIVESPYGLIPVIGTGLTVAQGWEVKTDWEKYLASLPPDAREKARETEYRNRQAYIEDNPLMAIAGFPATIWHSLTMPEKVKEELYNEKLGVFGKELLIKKYGMEGYEERFKEELSEPFIPHVKLPTPIETQLTTVKEEREVNPITDLFYRLTQR